MYEEYCFGVRTMKLDVAPTTTASSVSTGRKCILVLGMHRSGTSALARQLNFLGAVLPRNVMGARHSNLSGHWEPERLVVLHDQMLSEAGSRWDDWRTFDLTQLGSERLSYYKAEIARLITEEYENASLFILKDPRICRFFPLYVDVLSTLEITPVPFLIFRNPLAVIASLEVRDGMTARYASFVWLRHVLDAEIATRGKPRAFISYEGLLSDWHGKLDEIGLNFGLVWPPVSQDGAETEAFLTNELRHHAPSNDDLMSRANIDAWIKDAYSALCALEKNCDNADALAILDKIRVSFDTASSNVTDAVFEELWARQEKPAVQKQESLEQFNVRIKSVSRQQSELNALHNKIAEQKTKIAGAQRMLVERDEALATTQRSLAKRDEALATTQRSLAERDRALAITQRSLAERNETLAATQRTLVGRDETITVFHRTLAERDEALAILQRTLAERDDTLAAQAYRIAAIYASRSWRMLSPIRWIVGTVRGIFRRR